MADFDDEDDDKPLHTGPTLISIAGKASLRAEHAELTLRERPRVVREVADAAAMGDRSENAEYIYGKKRLREIDKRIHHLERRIRETVEVEPELQRRDGRAIFGCTLQVEDEDGAVSQYRVVGPDEIDPARGWISYKSPFGAALLGARAGDEVTLRTPGGLRACVVISVSYE